MSQELEQAEPAFMRAVKAAAKDYFSDPDAEGRLSRAELISQLRSSDYLGQVRDTVGELWQHNPSDAVLKSWSDITPFMTEQSWSTARELALDALSDS